MTFNELSDNLFQNYESGVFSDSDLVQIIERAAGYLNLKTITNTAMFRQKSYNGIKKHVIADVVIDDVKLYVNND